MKKSTVKKSVGKLGKSHKKINFTKVKTKTQQKGKPTKENDKLKINLPFEEAIKIAFTTKNQPKRK
jgi:adenylate kinase